MAEYVLYCFAQSGNAYKAALTLALSGAEWEPRFVDYFNGETRTAAYREINDMGEVPVLLHGARKLSQSGVILTYLAERTGRFGPTGEDERLEVLRWLLYDNHKFTSYVATRRFLLNFAKTGETETTRFFLTRAQTALAVVEARLENRSFVVGSRPTIADLSMCSYLYWPDEIGISLSDYPNIRAWLDRIAALPGWRHPYELMPGHPLPAR